MSSLRLVARNEWQLMRRSRVAQIAIALLLVLAGIAAITSIAHRNANDDLRARFQAQANSEFDGQPARHPHRMVHYGHFVFRPLPPLAAFDPGVDAFTGSTIFLEGHRQNSANFGDVRQSSLLARFGQLTPAFVLQALAPLVLIFVGFGLIAREREAGTLRLLTASGASPGAILGGKALALSGVAALMLIPAGLALLWMMAAEGAGAVAAGSLLLGYATYLAVWVAAIAGVSAIASTPRAALIALLAMWAVATVLLPRVAPEAALSVDPLTTKLETDIAIQRELREIGDSHDPDDPHFEEFKTSVLQEYGVDRIEDLPFNYNGLLAMEGETLTSSLFDQYAARETAQEKRHAAIVTSFGVISPTIALNRLSITLAGTGMDGHRRFLEQAEAYRFAIVQQLNQLQAEAVTFADDSTRNSDPVAGRRVRIDPEHWHEVPDFTYRGATTGERLQAAAAPALILLFWLLVAGLFLREARNYVLGAH
ncbi:ABC transporter permease [Alteraurantiacibacter aquimixticola]|uniref:DUF3526 domain-containing protein n=1 Tax=Alteraurantiacibacter aquimixticola TaxID=2489173 RepID=A0A4T3F397_9SPHN|nr:DUF3526 domain-containing protein [Alteraurantiacibacter aquimixticola]TIX51673.1 DUF3526 domain-containing protein [Alteraurantiacibacter aquimixticola]